MVRNKKGLMRIVEATIAVIVIFGVLIVLASQREPRAQEDLSQMLPPILEEISQNFSLREEIVSGVDGEATEIKIEEMIQPRISNPYLGYSVELCDMEEVCYLDPYPSDTEDEIYASERVISSSMKNGNFDPKKLKIFLWKKSV